MDYKMVDWQEATDLKNQKTTKEFSYLEFNLATVYLLKDSSYMVMPLNPFGKSLIIYKKDSLDKYIRDELFPLTDDMDSLYYERKNEIDHLTDHRESLKSELFRFYFGDASKIPSQITARDIDSIHQRLKEKKKFKQYKLNFIVLIGDYIIDKFPDKNYKWGLLKMKQLINPLIHLVIVKDAKAELYFDIEDQINGRHGYFGAEDIARSVERYSKKTNEVEKFMKVM